MRILILAPQPFFVQRGTPMAVLALAEVLTKQGHSVDALVFAEGSTPDISGLRVFRVPALPGVRKVSPGFSLKKILCDALMLPLAARRLWAESYDLVIAVEEAAFMALILKSIFRVPYIYDMDSSIPEQLSDKYDLPDWLHGAIAGAEARAARGAMGAITCCSALQDVMQGYAPDVPVQTLEDVTLIQKGEGDPEDCRFDAPVIMYVGNLEGYQGVELLVHAAALAFSAGAQAQLVIIGGAEPQISVLCGIAEELGIRERVSFLGPRPVARIGDYLSQACIVVSPRIQGRNTPMKIYSYLDSGRPLLATRLPTHTQVLDDDIAMLVAPTPEDMARGIEELLADPERGRQLAAAARLRVAEDFSPEAFARKLTGFFDREIVPRLASA